MPNDSSLSAGSHESSAPVSTSTDVTTRRSPGRCGFSTSTLIRNIPTSDIVTSMAIKPGIAILLAVALAPAWHVAREAGSGCWPPACTERQLPLATPVVSHSGKLIMIADGAAPTRGYESRDGITWRGFDHDARWGARYKSADASYAGAI